MDSAAEDVRGIQDGTAHQQSRDDLKHTGLGNTKGNNHELANNSSTGCRIFLKHQGKEVTSYCSTKFFYIEFCRAEKVVYLPSCLREKWQYMLVLLESTRLLLRTDDFIKIVRSSAKGAGFKFSNRCAKTSLRRNSST